MGEIELNQLIMHHVLQLNIVSSTLTISEVIHCIKSVIHYILHMLLISMKLYIVSR